MSTIPPIEWEDKVNSPELLAFISQFGEKYYLSAEGINELRDKMNYLINQSNYALNPNEVLKYGDINVVDLALTVVPNAFAWRIDHEEFLETPYFGILLNAASNGYYRYDLLQGNKSGNYSIKSSIETLSVGVPPKADEDCIALATILILGDSLIGNPDFPTVNYSYVQKMESQDFILNYGPQEIINQINLVDERNSISLTGLVTDLKSLQISGEYIRQGKPHFIKNRTGHVVTIWHNSGTGNVKYYFPNAQNYEIQPGEVIEFSMNANDSINVKHEFVGASISVLDKAKAYSDSLVAGLLQLIGSYNPATHSNQYPSTGGSGVSGAIMKGDFWIVSGLGAGVEGTIGTKKVTDGDSFFALIDSPGQSDSNWEILENNIGYTPENSANKSDDIETNKTSSSIYVSAKGIVVFCLNYLIGNLPAKATVLVDSDKIVLGDSEDSNKTKTRTFAQLLVTLGTRLAVYFQSKDTKFYIGSSVNVQNTWSGCTVFFTASCTITVPATLAAGFEEFAWRTMPGVTITWAITSPFVWETTPTTTPEKQDGLFTRYNGGNTIINRW